MVKEPTDKRHIPEHLRADVAAVLGCIDFETKQLDRIRDAGKEAQSPCEIGAEGNERRYPSKRMRRRRIKKEKHTKRYTFCLVRHQGLEPWTP